MEQLVQQILDTHPTRPAPRTHACLCSGGLGGCSPDPGAVLPPGHTALCLSLWDLHADLQVFCMSRKMSQMSGDLLIWATLAPVLCALLSWQPILFCRLPLVFPAHHHYHYNNLSFVPSWHYLGSVLLSFFYAFTLCSHLPPS